MALKLAAGSKAYKFGILGTGDTAANKIVSKTIQKSFDSENEVLSGSGGVKDVVYSGEQEQITETTYSDSSWFNELKNNAEFGTDGSLGGEGVVTSYKAELSNEDLVKVTLERLKIKL